MNGPREHQRNAESATQAQIKPLEGVTSVCRTCPVTLSPQAYAEIVDALRGAKPPKEREHLYQRLVKAVVESREVHLSIARQESGGSSTGGGDER